MTLFLKATGFDLKLSLKPKLTILKWVKTARVTDYKTFTKFQVVVVLILLFVFSNLMAELVFFLQDIIR